MADWDTVDEWEDGDKEWKEYKQRMQELETENDEETDSLIEECCEEPTQVKQPPAQPSPNTSPDSDTCPSPPATSCLSRGVIVRRLILMEV